VHHKDLDGLKMLKENCPPSVELTSGEYGFAVEELYEFLGKQALDVLQADATRCGISGFLQIASTCQTLHIQMSSHCAPALHLHLGCSLNCVRHLEYFYDHSRIENMFFDGNCKPENGFLTPDMTRPGIGLDLKENDIAKYEIQL
jgi:L-alanine-DL-glutamate epimerase-like enolase superfamily enzyme